MRLASIELDGFRGFPRRRFIDLDADAVIVSGANGNGKTSLFDGILWGLTGRLPRLRDDAQIVSLFSESGQTRVTIGLKSPDDKKWSVTRSFDGARGRVSVEEDKLLHGPAAEARLIELLWPEAGSASDPADAFATALTRSAYLQQDMVRHFVEAASDHDRFTAVSELVGSGRVTELQESLERAKRAWTTVTNQQAGEVRALRERLTAIEARIAGLQQQTGEAQAAVAPDQWESWWEWARQYGLATKQTAPGAPDASAALDVALKDLDTIRRQTERRSMSLRAILAELAESESSDANVEELRDAVVQAELEVEAARVRIASEQARLSEVRRKEAAKKDGAEQLRLFASYALQQLDADHCPVCQQSYDRLATRRRLEAIAQRRVDSPEHQPDSNELEGLLSALAARERDLSNAILALRAAEQNIARRDALHEAAANRLVDLGLRDAAEASIVGDMSAALVKVDEALMSLRKLQEIGESFSLRLSRAAAESAMRELGEEAERLRPQLAEGETIVAARNRTGGDAQAIIEALRDASSAVVERRLKEIGPLLQNIYARIDPHPAFQAVSFLSHMARGRGQLTTMVSDPVEDKHSHEPAAVLSSSQVSALAVAVFLTLNLGIPVPSLAVTILDDPLQSLDDINLLGLVDLLRRAKEQRQMFVSTHDSRFAQLLARKLRPVESPERTVVVELEGWSRKGPRVEVRDVRPDPARLRLVPPLAG